jgi:hypothetical protein
MKKVKNILKFYVFFERREGEERRGKNDFQTAYVFMALHLTTPIHQEGSS